MQFFSVARTYNRTPLSGRTLRLILFFERFGIRNVESKNRTYHGRDGTGQRTTGRRGRVGQDGALRKQFAQKTSASSLQGFEGNDSECLSRSTNKRKSSINRWKNKSPIDERFICMQFISRTRSALCFWLLTSALTLFCLCKHFSCKACREK